MYQPTPSPLSIPFAHWHLLSADELLSAPVTSAAYLQNKLVCGLRSGLILICDAPTDSKLLVRSYLLGHTASIVSLELLTMRAETGLASEEENFLLGLSADGQLTKWSLKSGRCLQSLQNVVPFRPLGSRIVKTAGQPRNGLGGRFLKSTYIFLYGCSTEIVVLDAFTLSHVLTWTRNADWPIPLHYQSKDNASQILTAMEDGSVETWTFRATPTPSIQKTQESVFSVRRPELGKLLLLAAGCEEPRISVVQKYGFSVWEKIVLDEKTGQEDWCVIYQQKFDDGILDASAASANLVTVWTADGDIFSHRWDEREEGFVQTVTSLSLAKGTRISALAVPQTLNARWVVFSSSLEGESISISDNSIISEEKQSKKRIFWTENVLPCFSQEPFPSPSFAASSSSAIFSNMLVFACGKSIRFYTLASFLLDFNEPSQVFDIPQCSGKIVLLKTVRLREHVSGIEKEFLILGTTFGEIRIIDGFSNQVSSRIPVSTTALNSATKLPSDLGKRLKDTLLVTSVDGTAAILDVDRAKIMAVFPGHDHKYVMKFSTKPGENLIMLTYSDGISREWEFGDDECAVLIGPHSHHSSKPASREGPIPTALPELAWREVLVAEYWKKDDDVFDVENFRVFSICDVPSHCGIPTAAINLRHVLGEILFAMDTNRQGSRLLPRNHPALITARAVLMSLLPNIRQLFDHVPSNGGSASDLILDSDDLLPASPRCPTLGQIGSGGNIALISPYLAQKSRSEVVAEGVVGGILNISPTVTAIGQLCILAIIRVILDAIGKSEKFSQVADVLLVGKDDARKKFDGFIPPSLGVFAKFWLDPFPVVRSTAEYILEAYMSGLSDNHRKNIVSFWQEFLPVNVDPQLIGSAKQIPRSVTLLTFLLSSKPSFPYPIDLAELLSRSFERMLEPTSLPYYKLLATSLLASNWILFQANFHDPVHLLQILIQLPENALCLAQISRQNYPLLISAYTGLLTSTPSQLSVIQGLLAVIQINPPPFQLLNTFITSLCKVLEASHHQLQRVLQPIIRDLCTFIGSVYPQAAYEPGHNRLATSLSRGLIVVYELKTGTAAFRLEGHTGVGYSLKWGGEGMRLLAAIDVEEATAVVWRVSGGFLSSFMTRETESGAHIVTPRGKWRIGKGNKVLEWHGEKAVVIRKDSGEEVRVNIA